MLLLIRLGLVLASATIAVVGAEMLLRATLDVEQLFDNLRTRPELASEGWARVFLRDYDAFRESAELGADLGGFRHDTTLGWDTPEGVRPDSHAWPASEHPPVHIVAVGDSFTYGAEVADDETYPAYLERSLPGSEVINLGVRAYGVDQAASKFWLRRTDLAPDVLVFGVFSDDYYRTALHFFRFAKPTFGLSEDRRRLTIANLPVPSRDEVFVRLQEGLPPLSFLYALARKKLLGSSAWEHLTGNDERFFYRLDAIHRRILATTRRLAEEGGTRVLFVYVPMAPEFGPWAPEMTPDRARILDLFDAVGGISIDLVAELLARYPAERVYADFYLWTHGRHGHFSPRGNHAVAEILAEQVGRALSSPAGMATEILDSSGAPQRSG